MDAHGDRHLHSSGSSHGSQKNLGSILISCTHGGTVVVEVYEGVVMKSGSRVRREECLAMELVVKNTDVPVPRPIGHGAFDPIAGKY